jgi:hypothetical protein
MVGNFHTDPFAQPSMKLVAGGIFTMGSDPFYPSGGQVPQRTEACRAPAYPA